MVQVGISAFTDYAPDNSVLVEDEGNNITFRFDLDQAAPTGGLTVYLDSNLFNSLSNYQLGQAFNPASSENIEIAGVVPGDDEFPNRDFDSTGLVVTIREGSTFGTLTLPVFDGPEPDPVGPASSFDGLRNVTYTLKTRDQIDPQDLTAIEFNNGDGVDIYTIDPNATSTGVLTLVDTASQLSGGGPKISISATPSIVAESEGTALTLNFTVEEGTIPAGGLPIQLQVDSPNNPNNFWFLDFLSGELEVDFYEIEGTGVNLLEVDSSGNPDPGSGKFGFVPPPFNGPITLVLTDTNASLTFPIFNDNIPEPNEQVSFTLLDGADYDLGTNSTTAVTLQDSPAGTVNPSNAPTVSISASPTVLIEEEETEYTITINVDEPIPAGGLDIIVSTGIPNAVGEFAVGRPRVDTDGDGIGDTRFVTGVATTGLADPFTVDGVTGSFSLQPTEIGDGFFATVVDQTATITLKVANDGIPEGTEFFTYSLLDGENYEVDPNAGSYDLRIEDTSVEKILGTNEDDILVGADIKSIIHGRQGNDTIRGEGGNDLLKGNQGSDRLLGGEGSDTLSGGSGQDTILGEAGDDILNGNGGRDRLLGGEDNDTISGGNGRDTILGEAGDDSIKGNNGKDTLLGGTGNDSIEGNDGKDLLRGENGDDTLFGGNGKDTLLGESGNDILSGDKLADRLVGGEGNDSAFGGQGQDTILGEAGDDLLSGDAGDDRLLGGDGADSLMGVTGNDTLLGEGGSDTFVFGNGDGTDVIVDFEDGIDSIGLVDGELIFDDLTISRIGANVVLDITETGERLALVRDLDAVITLDITDFVTVPDISSIDDVL